MQFKFLHISLNNWGYKNSRNLFNPRHGEREGGYGQDKHFPWKEALWYYQEVIMILETFFK